jgi:hypothetical protein
MRGDQDEQREKRTGLVAELRSEEGESELGLSREQMREYDGRRSETQAVPEQK